jgi:hypothetical protein
MYDATVWYTADCSKIYKTASQQNSKKIALILRDLRHTLTINVYFPDFFAWWCKIKLLVLVGRVSILNCFTRNIFRVLQTTKITVMLLL